ncbi:MAG TPA: ABC transporter substrate-binding protein [Longimicrobium sp.]|nr:ABC transporter substrate-binding protein [Longimicrobium sp.]
MINPKRIILSALPLAALLAGCGGTGEDVVFGVAAPLEGANGKSVLSAARMAAAEINAGGGIGGRNIVLIPKDDKHDEQRGLAVAHELRADPSVLAVIGHVNSAVSMKAAPIYNMDEGENDSVPGEPVVQISPASSAPTLTHAGPWTFRVTPTDLEFSPVLARWARERLRSSRAAVLYANDEYGQGVASTFANAFRRQGGTVISADPYLAAMTRDPGALDAYLTRAIRRDADALVIGGQADGAVAIITAARRLGYRGPILGADGVTGVKDAGPIGEGVYISSSFLPDRDSERARAFVAAYQKLYGTLPDHRAAMTYDIMYMLKAAIESGAADRLAIRRYLEGVTTEKPYEGISGQIRFDKNGDVVEKPVSIGVVRGGRLVTAR